MTTSPDICPKCLSIVTNRRRHDGGSFMGCTAYPDCDFTMSEHQFTMAWVKLFLAELRSLREAIQTTRAHVNDAFNYINEPSKWYMVQGKQVDSAPKPLKFKSTRKPLSAQAKANIKRGRERYWKKWRAARGKK